MFKCTHLAAIEIENDYSLAIRSRGWLKFEGMCPFDEYGAHSQIKTEIPTDELAIIRLSGYCQQANNRRCSI